MLKRYITNEFSARSPWNRERVRLRADKIYDRPTFNRESCNQFNVIREIGRGGFGIVYLAQDIVGHPFA